MADRFVSDILNDTTPMVTTSRYTDQLFTQPKIPSKNDKNARREQQQQQNNSNRYNNSSSNNNNIHQTQLLSGSALQQAEEYYRQQEKEEARARGDLNLVEEIEAEERLLQNGRAASSEEEAHNNSISIMDQNNRYEQAPLPDNDDDLEQNTQTLTTGISPRNNGGSNDNKSVQEPQMEAEDKLRAAIADEVAWMLRFALLFINFTFIVASLLMALAGSIAVNTPNLVICKKCQDLAVAPVVLGMIMWFSGLFAFYWIKQRNILPLLLHAGIMMLAIVSLVIIIIIAIVFNGTITQFTQEQILASWTASLPNVSSVVRSPLCALQQKNNCSGVAYGCCNSDLCYNKTSPPFWVPLVCPDCGPRQASSSDICELSMLQSMTSADMEGFIVVLVFAFILIITGMGLALFVRKINNSS